MIKQDWIALIGVIILLILGIFAIWFQISAYHHGVTGIVP